MASQSHPYLAPEIILQIIDTLFPPTTEPIPVAIPASHILTQTLLSLARTSRLTYPSAIRYLYTRCLYIDSFRRLDDLNRTLKAFTGRDPLRASTIPENERIEPPTQLPAVRMSDLLSSLYLVPFTRNDYFPISALQSIIELLRVVPQTLKRLIVSIPFEPPLNPAHFNADLDAVLNECFLDLTSLEVLCIIRSGRWGDMAEVYGITTTKIPGTAPRWPSLRVLALCHVDFSGDLLWDVWSAMASLERVVVVLPYGVHSVDFKEKWRAMPHAGRKPLEIALVHVESGHDPPLGKDPWGEGGDVALRLTKFNVPTSYYGDETKAQLCQGWVSRCLLRGEEMIS